MTRIGLLSDTHHFLDEMIFSIFEDCDEIWHAGDFGTKQIADAIIGSSRKKPIVFRGVFGNIDGQDIRGIYPEKLLFDVEDVRILMKHIGGYPGRYAPGVKDEIKASNAGMFVSGHSHILKVMYDEKLRCLHMNPGAAGKQGWHNVRTVLRFAIDGAEIKDCEVIELGAR